MGCNSVWFSLANYTVNKLCTQYCITGYIQSRNFCRTSNRLNFEGYILALAHAQ